MADRFEDRIRRYCDAHGVAIPLGFGRHAPNRYVVIHLTDPPKLVARTWLDVEIPYRVLDFKECEELQIKGQKRFERIGTFDL